ncbi:MAG: type II toxin-antitoxin system HicA family toxin [Nitrospirae bacterium]|nr:type II toxin-antitoxin system HicA family toxin [Nitrospirota bacterium]
MPKLPIISGKQLLSALKKSGFIEVRQKGSHVSLIKQTQDKTFRTIITIHSNLLKEHCLIYYIKLD